VDRTTLLLLVMALFVVLVILAVVGWIRRRRRQATIPATQSVPSDIGDVVAQVEGFYVSTTLDGEPLNRVAVRGLGFRARASFTVANKGVVLSLPGNDVFIRTSDIREVTTAQYTIDRVVEEGGLVLIAWTLGDHKLDSYLRVDQTAYLVAAIDSLLSDDAEDPIHAHNQEEQA
jgi:hypothetical protein